MFACFSGRRGPARRRREARSADHGWSTRAGGVTGERRPSRTRRCDALARATDLGSEGARGDRHLPLLRPRPLRRRARRARWQGEQEGARDVRLHQLGRTDRRRPLPSLALPTTALAGEPLVRKSFAPSGHYYFVVPRKAQRTPNCAGRNHEAADMRRRARPGGRGRMTTVPRGHVCPLCESDCDSVTDLQRRVRTLEDSVLVLAFALANARELHGSGELFVPSRNRGLRG